MSAGRPYLPLLLNLCWFKGEGVGAAYPAPILQLADPRKWKNQRLKMNEFVVYCGTSRLSFGSADRFILQNVFVCLVSYVLF